LNFIVQVVESEVVCVVGVGGGVGVCWGAIALYVGKQTMKMAAYQLQWCH